MKPRQFQGYNCDLAALQESIEIYFVGKGFRVTNFHKENVYLTQAAKSVLGRRCVLVRLMGTPLDFEATMGTGVPIQSLADPPPALAGVSLSEKLAMGGPRAERDFWNFLATETELKRNTFTQAVPVAVAAPQILTERETVREVEVVYCRYCGAKNNARITSCTKCGANLH